MNNSNKFDYIPYGKQHISKEDVDAVSETLLSKWLTQGPKIKEFENEFSNYVNSKYAVAVSNGTAALHLCALALGVTKEQKVITTPITFVASANCIKYAGGEILFADIDPNTYLIDIEYVKKILKNNPKGSIKGIIVVDFGGNAVNLEEYKKLADEYDLWIIEDACHAPGGYFQDSKLQIQKCGNSNFADLSIFSFHPVKHIACGEGGMITTNNKQLYERLLKLRSHGIVKEEQYYLNDLNTSIGLGNKYEDSEESYPDWYMEMQELGYNYRLTDIQAALGISQLKRADNNLLERKRIALKYDMAFQNHPKIKTQKHNTGKNNEGHAYHLYIIECEDRLKLFKYLRNNNIIAQVHYIPAHLMPYYKNLGWKYGDLPIAEKYYDHCLSIPIYPTLTDEEQDFVITKILEFYDAK